MSQYTEEEIRREAVKNGVSVSEVKEAIEHPCIEVRKIGEDDIRVKIFTASGKDKLMLLSFICSSLAESGMGHKDIAVACAIGASMGMKKRMEADGK